MARPRPGQDTTIPFDLLEDDGILGRQLLVLGEGTFAVHALPESGRLAIGRAEDADVRIDHQSISRRHAILHVGDSFAIEDVGSSNGTRVGGNRLASGERVEINPGELVEVGSAGLLIQGVPEVPEQAGPASSGVRRLESLADRVAKSAISVLLLGETGVGKEVFALRIHDLSPRRERAFLPLNCGALSEQLLESELFGHEAGAFTGAVQTKPGLLETAEGGTVFLDEVGELPMSAQVKLLRVLEDRRVLRVGGLESRPIDVRFVAATNRDLRKAVADGDFRQDLFYRLNGISLVIPPLRERTTEIPALAQQFIEEAAERSGLSDRPELTNEGLAALESHNWPGNIRELRNVIERAVVLSGGEPITPEHLFADPSEELLGSNPDEMDERAKIIHALQQHAGNQTRAAEMLGISRKTLGAKLDAFGIARPRKRKS